MRNSIVHLIAAMIIFSSNIAFSDEGAISYEKIVRENLKQMTKISGTFDLYDSEADQVRNLRLIEILPDVTENEGVAKVPARFRDIKSGDFVIVEVTIHNLDNDRYDSKWSIVEVEKLKKSVDKKESIENEDVLAAMNAYLEKQTKFTGYLMLFDQENEKMRKLELIEINKDFRQFGILSIAASTFKDTESEETLTIDIKVKNNDGVLEVDSLKIKKIRK